MCVYVCVCADIRRVGVGPVGRAGGWNGVGEGGEGGEEGEVRNDPAVCQPVASRFPGSVMELRLCCIPTPTRGVHVHCLLVQKSPVLCYFYL